MGVLNLPSEIGRKSGIADAWRRVGGRRYARPDCLSHSAEAPVADCGCRPSYWRLSGPAPERATVALEQGHWNYRFAKNKGLC